MLRWLGFIWALPGFVVLWGLYVLPLWATKRIRLNGQSTPLVWCFDVNEALVTSWWVRQWGRWAGFAGHSVVIVKPSAVTQRVLRHELRHTRQAFALGVLYFPVYGALLLIYGYRNHPLERDARAHEGDE